VPVPAEIFKAYDVRGLYGDQIDGDVAEAVGRAFALVLADLAGKPASELRIGLGRDMRLSAPELAARYRDGMVAEGATVVDAGQVGSEMLYYLVGARDLDGGLMCTASHNPKAYTGAKLVKQGAIALSGDAGIQDVRRRIEDGLGETSDPPARGSVEEVDVYDDFQAAALRFIDPDRVKPLRVVVDGGNGMAGPMVGPLLERLGLDLVTAYWEPDGEFPDHEPNPLLPENREFIMRKVVEAGADLGIAWDGDADRCFFIDDTGRFVDGDFLTALLAESLLRKSPGEAILYDVRASRAVADTVARAGGSSHPNRVGLQDAHARRGRDVRRRGLRPLLLPRLLLRRQRHDPGAAHPRVAERRGAQALRAAGAVPVDVLHLRRDQQRGRRRAGAAGGDRAALRRRAHRPPRRRLRRLRRLALQRPHLEHRAAHAPVPGVARVRGGHGAPPRRGARPHPRVTARRSSR
jgi:hypothetical protein